MKKFSSYEYKWLVLTALLLGFVLSFTKWGTTTFNATEGIANLILAVLIVLISLFIKLSVQKYASLKVGVHAEFKPWLIGLILGVVFVFITNGAFVFLAVGTLIFKYVEHLRVGHRGNPMSFATMGRLAALGPITYIVLAMICKALSGISPIFAEAMSINLWMALYAVLPIPFFEKIKEINGSEGLLLFASSRMAYVGTLLFVLTNMFSLLYFSVPVALLVSLVLTVCGWIFYYIFIEYGLS